MSKKNNSNNNSADALCSDNEIPEKNLSSLSGQIENDEQRIDIGHSGNGTIVLMDDDECILDSVSGMLMVMGYDVIHMEDGKEVISFLNDKHFGDEKITAIILDLIIPGGMGGKETVLEIRKINPGIPVFAISGYTNDPIMSNPRDFGFTESLRKPFLIRDLADMLKQFL